LSLLVPSAAPQMSDTAAVAGGSRYPLCSGLPEGASDVDAALCAGRHYVCVQMRKSALESALQHEVTAHAAVRAHHGLLQECLAKLVAAVQQQHTGRIPAGSTSWIVHLVRFKPLSHMLLNNGL
jgi:hypothetical protein